jgi:hypothetical protein
VIPNARSTTSITSTESSSSMSSASIKTSPPSRC